MKLLQHPIWPQISVKSFEETEILCHFLAVNRSPKQTLGRKPVLEGIPSDSVLTGWRCRPRGFHRVCSIREYLAHRYRPSLQGVSLVSRGALTIGPRRR